MLDTIKLARRLCEDDENKEANIDTVMNRSFYRQGLSLMKDGLNNLPGLRI